MPASLEALAVELQRAPESTLLPLGGGTDGLAATQPDALYLLDGLLEPASVDETSATLDLPASMTWGAAQALAVAYGLTLTDIPDAFADATIGGTLARQPWQPTLHHSATARARCIGLSAMLNTGERYRYKTASRTASRRYRPHPARHLRGQPRSPSAARPLPPAHRRLAPGCRDAATPVRSRAPPPAYARGCHAPPPPSR
jgi:FAD/FMN-containing dehydrogenase